MMLSLLTHWKLYAGAVAAILLVGYVGSLNVQLAAEKAHTARLSVDLAHALGERNACNARLMNILERIESDATVSDDLGGFDVPPGWMLDSGGSD
jgi:hypothetical protein